MPERRGEPVEPERCMGCRSPLATQFSIGAEVVALCPGSAAFEGLGCP